MTNDENVVEGRFSALGHSGSETYVGLEIIDLEEEVKRVWFESDEFTAVCPVTKQPDLYDLQIELKDTQYSIESKSLKIFLGTFRNKGAFAETLAIKIKAHVLSAIRDHAEDMFFQEEQVEVTITQKRRGGIEIEVEA
jgi:7-cyano-7-deazaguanine reductase